MTAQAMPSPLRDVLDGAPSLFLSPHLDDAVFSAGGTLAALAAGSSAARSAVVSCAARCGQRRS